MKTVALSLSEIYGLAHAALAAAGADEDNAAAVAKTVVRAEQDGAAAHGLFRIPGYAAGLKSGKINGRANPTPQLSGVVLRCDGQNGYAPLALQRCAEPLANAALQNGIAALALTRSHHFAALWPETEALAERGVAALACVCYAPAVAPAGGKTALFGTNPISFAWPRPKHSPLVFDMATAAMAKGEVQIFARENKPLPPGTGLDSAGNPATDAAEVLRGVLLPFGGHKGSALAMMVELLAAAMVGENFSYEAAAKDNKDGAPPQGGELIIALSPQILAGEGWESHAESFIQKMAAMDGVRLPGGRRHANRKNAKPRAINAELVEKIRNLAK
ncbi:MAG: Ldh family oxidoreductase [Betaproteobacteria bacterium]|nr:Ldh family oxidoreductase [Betaproteobacteria bacterium]